MGNAFHPSLFTHRSSPITHHQQNGAARVSEPIDEFEFFLDKHWSDGLPVVTPTEERVARMLTATKRDPNEVVGNIPPAMEPATVRTVAIHALMAGCKPEYLPVVLGAIKLMLREEFN